MEHEAAADIAEDCLLDASKDCQDCANSRLIERQMEEIRSLKVKLAAINEDLEVQKGRNAVLTYQINSLRDASASGGLR